MKQLLSDFVNLFFPKEEGEEWSWGEIILMLGGLGVVMTLYILFSR